MVVVVSDWADADEDVDVETGEIRSAGSDESDAAPVLYFSSLPEFVDHLANLYQPAIERSELAWCSDWWRHAEAVSRLESLWRAWEHLRLDPALGMSVWWRDHLDPHMGQLLDRDRGPFRGCSPANGHRDTDRLALTEPPASLFPRVQ